MSNRVVASIEARMSSSRLPGKVLMDVNGRPALERLVHRLRKSARLDDVVLATSTNAADDPLEAWARQAGVPVFRGSEDDVLARVVDAHRFMKSDVIVEVTGDSILTDAEIIDMGIQTFFENECDVVCNVRKASFPMGVDIQVFRRSDLEKIADSISDPAVREHVSLYFYENPALYRVIHLFAPARWHRPDFRFQLDYEEDLRFIRAIYTELEPTYGDGFGLDEIISLLNRRPELLEINRHCVEKPHR